MGSWQFACANIVWFDLGPREQCIAQASGWRTAADRRAKFPEDGLMAAMRFIHLLAIEPEGLEDGSDLSREQDVLLRAIIRVLMPGPWRHHAEVAGLPS